MEQDGDPLRNLWRATGFQQTPNRVEVRIFERTFKYLSKIKFRRP